MLAERLEKLGKLLARAERAALHELEALTDAPPRCPRCGATMTVRTAKKKRYNGASFWGCPNYLRCGQGPVPLMEFPCAAYAAVTRTRKARA